MTLNILPFLIEAYDEVMTLWRQCEGVGLSDADSRENIRSYLERNPGMSFVALTEGRIIGAVLAGHDGRRGYIHHLAVHPEWRRLGLGRELVDRSLQTLKGIGIHKCHLFIFNDNTGGIDFWKSVGWQQRMDIIVMSMTFDPVVGDKIFASSSTVSAFPQTKMTVEPFILRKMTSEDWPAVRSIFEEGIATGNATFETEAPSWEAWDAGHINECRLVATQEDRVVGWAALSRVSGRCVYAGVAEVSVYLSAKERGRGIGRRLVQALIPDSETTGIWPLQAAIFPENEQSITLHRKCGFRMIGRRERLGQMNGLWRDVLMFERRSSVTGIGEIR